MSLTVGPFNWIEKKKPWYVSQTNNRIYITYIKTQIILGIYYILLHTMSCIDNLINGEIPKLG